VRNKRGRRLMGDINVVPYIDVMLVLLVIFMVTAPMLSQGIKVDLPKAAAEPIPPDKLEPLVLSIDRDGLMYLNIGDPRAAQTPDRILEIASAAMRREPERPVLVKADTTVAYGRVVEGMVLLQRSGAKRVGFITEPVGAVERPRAKR
jgi:biopolymer transport protein TolR